MAQEKSSSTRCSTIWSMASLLKLPGSVDGFFIGDVEPFPTGRSLSEQWEPARDRAAGAEVVEEDSVHHAAARRLFSRDA